MNISFYLQDKELCQNTTLKSAAQLPNGNVMLVKNKHYWYLDLNRGLLGNGRPLKDFDQRLNNKRIDGVFTIDKGKYKDTTIFWLFINDYKGDTVSFYFMMFLKCLM